MENSILNRQVCWSRYKRQPGGNYICYEYIPGDARICVRILAPPRGSGNGPLSKPLHCGTTTLASVQYHLVINDINYIIFGGLTSVSPFVTLSWERRSADSERIYLNILFRKGLHQLLANICRIKHGDKRGSFEDVHSWVYWPSF